MSDNKPVARLIGQDGNIFNLVGIACRALKRAGQADKADELTSKVFECENYDAALALIGQYVTIE